MPRGRSLARARPDHTAYGDGMDFRYLGNSGLKISEITYGNWLTHGSQVENDIATQCVRAALDAGITTFDTADVYANTEAETVLGEALKGERRESLEIFTKVYWPTGPGGKNDTGLSRKHIMESINGSLDAPADRLRRPLPGPPLRHRDAARGDDAGVRRRRPPGQGALHRRQRVDRRADPRRARAGQGARHPADLEPAAVLDAVAGHRGRGRARRARSSASRQIVWSPDRAGRADRQVPARAQAAAGGLARHRREGRRRHDQAVHERRRAHPGAGARADRRRASGSDHGPARRRLGAAERQRRRRHHRRLAARAGRRERQGRRREARARADDADRRRRSATSSSGTRARPRRTRRRSRVA